MLQLLFQYLPVTAQKASKPSNNGHKNGHSTSDPPAISNGQSHSVDGQSGTVNGSEPLSSGQNGSSEEGKALPNGYSSPNGDSNNLIAAADTQQPRVQVDGQTNGISKKTAHQQAIELQEMLQEEVEAYLDRRHIIDILHDFSGSHPPLASLLSCLRPLQPRLYSISSSQLEQPSRVQITVAVVRYTALGRERIGVTSTFLKERMQVCNLC